jgi:tRNA A-37 threonylcarbamoyl transferase component Bud32
MKTPFQASFLTDGGQTASLTTHALAENVLVIHDRALAGLYARHVAVDPVSSSGQPGIRMTSLLDIAPGTLFAEDYKVVSRLGAGGMGAVYVVEQLSTGKKRALKLMLPRFVTNEAIRKRFAQEARIGALIDSEHVVEVHAAGVDEESGTPWMVMELLEGETLEERVQRSGPLAPRDVRVVFEQLCHAVGAAHHAGVVHRDLKPENVFLSKASLVGHPDVAWGERSAANGINGDQTYVPLSNSGAGYLFVRSGATWSQQAYIKPSNAGGQYGTALAIGTNTIAIGAPNDSSRATGINGDQTPVAGSIVGAVYVLR